MGNEKAQLQFCLSNGLVAQLQQLNEQHAPRAIHWDKLSACTYSQGQTQKQGHKATAKLGTVKRFPCTPTTKVQHFLYISGCVQKAKFGLTSHINTNKACQFSLLALEIHQHEMRKHPVNVCQYTYPLVPLALSLNAHVVNGRTAYAECKIIFWRTQPFSFKLNQEN